MNQDKIKQKQNEPFFLKCQFAAKCHFNKAEQLNYFVWLFCILSSMTIFISSENNWVVIGLPLLLDIIGCILEYCFEKNVAVAADLRNYFDANVLDINKSQYTVTDIRRIKDIVEKTVAKHSEECNIQITHTGTDTPPGVLDWYEFSHNFSDDEVQYECQRQNCWWSEKLSRRRVLASIAGLVINILLFLAICSTFNIFGDILRVIFCSGVIIKIFERFVKHYRCHEISLKIQGACELLETCKTKENTISLQDMIEKRRNISVLEVNGIHKKIAAKLTQHYRKIS